MLREGQQRAQDRTHTGRHLAAIQLDGACEHAMMLCVGELQETPAKTFHGNFDLLKSRLAGRWVADGWSGVNRLHGTRTEAQHRGTVPDPAEFARWSADAERFIKSLVAATFSVELQTVGTATAVESDEVRAELERAEAELNEGQFKESLRLSKHAFELARVKWSVERRDALGPEKPSPMPMQDVTAEDIRQAVERTKDLTEVTPFASDLGEYIWLRSTGKAYWDDAPVTQEDAERAFAFVIGWVLRWEAFSHRYTTDRVGKWRRSLRPHTTRDPSREPHIGSVEVLTPARHSTRDERRAILLLTLADLPDPGWASWLQAFRKKLSALWNASGLKGRPWPSERGVVQLEGIAVAEDVASYVELVKTAINTTNEMRRAALAEEPPRAAEQDRVVGEFADVLASIQFDGTSLVESVWAEALPGSEPFEPQHFCVAAKLDLSEVGTQKLAFWHALRTTGHLAPGTGGRLDLHDDVLRAPADMAATEVRDALAEAAQTIERDLAELRGEQVRDEEFRRLVEEEARKHAAD